MGDSIFRFSVGDFACAIVNDGTYTYHDLDKVMCENAPREQLAAALQEHGIELESWTEYVSPYPSLVVDTGTHRVLVDTGMGPRVPTTDKLAANLAAADFPLASFDVVVLSHVHPDHVGGNLDQAGRVAYPNARFVLWGREWDFWCNEPDLSGLRDDRFTPMMLDTARTYLPPIAPQVELLALEDREVEIVRGLTAVAAPGHTPGHLAVVVASGGEALLAVADAFLLPIHIAHPEWVAAVDLLVDETVATRRQLLQRAASEEMLVFAPHFPFPSLGHVAAQESGWRWLPQPQEALAK